MRARLSTEVGSAVRKLRLSKELTLADLSTRSGIPLSTLSKLELGQIALNYDKLVRLCRALEVDLEKTMFAEAQSAPTGSGRRSVTRAGGGDPRPFGPHHGHAAAADLLSKSVSPIVLDLVVAELAVHGPLQHLQGEAFAMVLSGSVRMLSEIYAPLELASGDSVYFDGRIGHAFLAGGGGPARLLLVVSGDLHA